MSTPPPSTPRDRWLRLGLVLLVAAAVAAFYLSGLYHELKWEAVRGRVESWQAYTTGHLAAALALFFLAYVACVALSLPVALILSLVAGALFGLWAGVGVVSLASTSGACLAFLGSRYLFRDWVRRRFGPRLAALDRGIERDGAWYLLTLRMQPVVPFFLVNLGMALTPLRLRTFAGVSWLGMLPATFVLVNTGREIGSLSQPTDALSPTFLLSLALLGLLPLIVRFVLRKLGRATPPASDEVG